MYQVPMELHTYFSTVVQCVLPLSQGPLFVPCLQYGDCTVGDRYARKCDGVPSSALWPIPKKRILPAKPRQSMRTNCRDSIIPTDNKSCPQGWGPYSPEASSATNPLHVGCAWKKALHSSRGFWNRTSVHYRCWREHQRDNNVTFTRPRRAARLLKRQKWSFTTLSSVKSL